MSVRILHCGEDILSYDECLQFKQAGFTQRGQEPGDLVYYVVRHKQGGKEKSVCGARGYLDSLTDTLSLTDGERYVSKWTVRDMEYCEPFELSFLSKICPGNVGFRYFQRAKPIPDLAAIEALDREFSTRIKATPTFFHPRRVDLPIPDETNNGKEKDNEDNTDSEETITIMGTFQVINFANETNRNQGLEPLVNQHFHDLFPEYPEFHTVLVKKNRLFRTSNPDGYDKKGVRGIPDALMILFTEKTPVPFRISLIEYECYGNGKSKPVDRFNYLNGHILPQLIRFASTFSVVTDKGMREGTVREWTEKLMGMISEDPDIRGKIFSWIRRLKPGIGEYQLSLEVQKHLEAAFRSNLQIILVIDDLSPDQRETIRNVIQSFRLESGEQIAFAGYTVRLEQRIKSLDGTGEYALSVK
jgi:hypothetical protein